MMCRRQRTKTASGVTLDDLLQRIRYEGAYPTLERARQVTLRALAALGRQLTGDERVDLAAVLPAEAARVFAAQVPATDRLTGWGLVKDLADRTGASPATTRWDVGTVFSVLADVIDPDLLDRILAQLPDGYPLLFGKVDLPRPQAAGTPSGAGSGSVMAA